jgi:hypothetical protein
MRHGLSSFLVVAFVACQSGQTNPLEKCRSVQDKVNRCLVDYCASSGDEVCRSVSTSTGSLFGETASSACDALSGQAMDDILAGDCGAIVEVMKDSLSGKADAPCPAYLPWCLVGGTGPKGYSVEVLHDDGSRVTLEITIDDVQVEGVVQDGLAYQKLLIPGNGTTTTVGAPAVPVINLVVGAPRDVTAASVTGYQKVEVSTTTDISVWPYQTPAREADAPPAFVRDDGVYGTDGVWPGIEYEVDPIAKWRNYKAARVKLYPVQYFPMLGRLEVARRFVVDLAFGSTDTDPDMIDEGESSFSTTYSSVMVNYEEVSSLETPVQDDPGRVRYLVITADAFDEAIQPLLKLKDEQFIRTKRTLLSEILPERSPVKNADAQKIKDHILSVYKEEGIEFVLLVGDVEDIPMYEEEIPGSWDPVRGDYWYSCLAGDDMLPEVAVGRIVGKTPEEVSAQVAKIVAYETGNPHDPWRQKVLLVTHKQEAPKKYTQCSESIRTGRYNYAASFVTLYGHERHTNQEIIDRMNEGVGIINYRGHGSETAWSEWNDEDFVFSSYQVTNAGRTPVVFSIACLNGKLDAEEETLSEQLVKRPEGGAVAVLAATKPSWTLQNHDFDRQLFRAILERGVKQIGKISNVAAVEMMTIWGDSNDAKENVKMYLWLGDPSLSVDLGSPPATPIPIGWCNIQHPPTLNETADLPGTDIFSQVWSDGVTNLPGQAPFIFVQVGYGPVGVSPEPVSSDADLWAWSSAYYNLDAGNNDEYMTRLLIHDPGEYAYAFRVSGDGGASFTTCDLDGSTNGIAPDQLGRVTVDPRPTMTVTNATLSWPQQVTVTAGAETEELHATLTVQPDTFKEELIPFVKAQLGFGPADTLPDAPEGWTWTDVRLKTNYTATLNYAGKLRCATPGSYLFTFRFSMDDGATWTAADKDGIANGIAADQLGTITVNPGT